MLFLYNKLYFFENLVEKTTDIINIIVEIKKAKKLAVAKHTNAAKNEIIFNIKQIVYFFFKTRNLFGNSFNNLLYKSSNSFGTFSKFTFKIITSNNLLCYSVSLSLKNFFVYKKRKSRKNFYIFTAK